jgi:hypothetical protein
MVKAACQCKGRDAAMVVVRITGPLYSNCHLPSADKPSICDQITSRKGIGDPTATGLETPPREASGGNLIRGRELFE